MLGPIAAVTISTPDVGRGIDAYARFLDYRLVHRGPVSAEQAASWGSPVLDTRDSALLAPQSGADFRLRLVECRAAVGYQPFRHLGWNAAEFLVEDVNALALRLEGSPFRIIGPPAALSFSDQIRAMQVLGPAGEVLYLTQITGKLAGFDTPVAGARVDRVFIAILGGPSVESLQEFYHAHLGVPRAPIIEAVISVISRAYDLPPRHLHKLAALPLGQGCYIEVDTLPSAVRPRPAANGELPPAIAMVTFRCAALPSTNIEMLSAPVALSDDPYRGRRSATCRGAAGELIELIEN